MIKKTLALFLAILMIAGLPVVAAAHPRQEEHDLDLKDVLFGEGYVLTGERKLIFQDIADAAALCIDQFSANESMRSKEDLFDSLDWRVGFSFSFDDIDLSRRKAGVNITATTHRRYTHRGWDFSQYSLKDLWVQRKKILTATVNKELFGESPGVLSKIPWGEGLIYSESACNDQCEAFCKLVYYVHILGDYEEATSYSDEFQQLIPLVRHEDPTETALIDELIGVLPVLFETQPWRCAGLIQELKVIKQDAEKILFVTGGIRTQEQFDAYKECSLGITRLLKGNIPDMLRKEAFFRDAFY